MKSRLLLIALLCIVTIHCKYSENKYTVVVDNVDGLTEGSLVICEGLPVGAVTYLGLFKDSVVVGIKINDGFHIPVGSKIIVEKSILGSSRLLIKRSKNTSFVTSIDTLSGYRDTTQYSIFSSDTAKQRKLKESIDKIADGIKGLIDASAKDTSQN